MFYRDEKEDREFDRVSFQAFIKILPDLILQLCCRKDSINLGFIIRLFANGFSLSEAEVDLDQAEAFIWIMTPRIYSYLSSYIQTPVFQQ